LCYTILWKVIIVAWMTVAFPSKCGSRYWQQTIVDNFPLLPHLSIEDCTLLKPGSFYLRGPRVPLCAKIDERHAAFLPLEGRLGGATCAFSLPFLPALVYPHFSALFSSSSRFGSSRNQKYIQTIILNPILGVLLKSRNLTLESLTLNADSTKTFLCSMCVGR
jgi:hypothetical protein